MADAKVFVERIKQMEGVSGCLLIKDDGALLGRALDDAETYTSLMLTTAGLAENIMDKVGFSYCRYVSFNRTNNQTFYIFPIDHYLLGLVQKADCSVADMLDRVYQLIGRVSTDGTRTVS
ncbi:MAG: roadblock/LC7 domain-containing protein [Thermodesulfobacteriota bacterium]|nr:roadblock/LC7 domain-containing protein [Thermodesulfobacteriota bacterium]